MYGVKVILFCMIISEASLNQYTTNINNKIDNNSLSKLTLAIVIGIEWAEGEGNCVTKGCGWCWEE